MSSIIVYGESARIGEKKVVTEETKPDPTSAYGMSKLKAEEGILRLNDENFHVCVLRPPMIYGPGCKGNYPLLRKAALKLFFFPDIRNERSMLFIDNLCAYIKAMVDGRFSGIHFPQNKEYICTSEMVRQIALAHGRKILMTKMFNPLLRVLSGKIGVVDKVFGNLTYMLETNNINGLDSFVSFSESIRRTENIHD